MASDPGNNERWVSGQDEDYSKDEVPCAVGPGTKIALTKETKALYSDADSMYPVDWGREEGFGPQSERAAHRAERHPRKVPIGRGRAFVSK